MGRRLRERRGSGTLFPFTKRERDGILAGMTGDKRQTIRHTRQILIDLSVMAGIGLLLALIGPFGSFSAPFAWRLVYWLVLAVSGYGLYRPIASIARRLAPKLDLPEPALWVAAGLIATVPMTAVVWTIGHLPGPVPAPGLNGALTLYGYVLVIGGGVMLLFYILNREGPAATPAPTPLTDPSEAPPPGALTPRFLGRLPPRLGTDLIALEMEDHYVRAHTALGSDLILMRMRDAVAELDGIEGAQVHRSWWVARDAVQGVSRDGRNLRLKLAGGLTAPVARGNVAMLEAAGWW